MIVNYDDYLTSVRDAADAVDRDAVIATLDALEGAYRDGRNVFVAGNGGSASNASHFAQDLSKGTLTNIDTDRRFRVLSLTDNVATITALSNDIGYERIFELQLQQFARSGDVLVLISGSGNSPNIVKVAQYAKEAGIEIIGVTGFDGGELMRLSDIKLHVPLDDMCKSEAVHSILFHYIADTLKVRFADINAG